MKVEQGKCCGELLHGDATQKDELREKRLLEMFRRADERKKSLILRFAQQLTT